MKYPDLVVSKQSEKTLELVNDFFIPGSKAYRVIEILFLVDCLHVLAQVPLKILVIEKIKFIVIQWNLPLLSVLKYARNVLVSGLKVTHFGEEFADKEPVNNHHGKSIEDIVFKFFHDV
jgi:hypothetical protein